MSKCKYLFSDDGNYVIPNIDSVVTGGTHQLGDWDTVIQNVNKPESKSQFTKPLL